MNGLYYSANASALQGPKCLPPLLIELEAKYNKSRCNVAQKKSRVSQKVPAAARAKDGLDDTGNA